MMISNDPDYDLAHTKLFQKMSLILTIFYSKKIEEIKWHLGDIRKMASDHFRDEETRMQEIEFPFMIIHKEAHNLILSKIDAVLGSLDCKSVSIEPLLKNLALTISEHVKHYDTVFIEYKNMIEEVTRAY